MTKKDLQQNIKEEILLNNIENWHGISKENINEYLIEPVLVDFMNASNGQLKKYWIVLDENPIDPINGYQIVYDQQENMFGLATKTGMEIKERGLVISLYDSFSETLNGM